jgi:hypothetical protein
MLTRAQINASSPVMDDVTVQYWASLIRNNKKYNPVLHPNLVSELEATDGDIRGQMLNALLVLIENIGAGEVKLSGGDDGIRYDQTLERDALVAYAISIVFDKVLIATVIAPAVNKLTSVNGGYGVGRQDLPCAICGFIGLTNCRC